MTDSLKASPEGLEIIDRARKQKRWNRQATIWYESALTSKATLKRFLQGEPIQQETFIRLCQAVGVENWQKIVEGPILEPAPPGVTDPSAPRRDWGEAPDLPIFYGRTEELQTLQHWILKDKCRMVALLGTGGIGKTALAVQLAKQIQNEFEVVVWRSLRNSPPVNDNLANLLQFLTVVTPLTSEAPEDFGKQLSRLIEYTRDRRCLLLLDDLETVLRSGELAGQYRQGYEGYGELLRKFGETNHKSCLLIASREKPQEIANLEGNTMPVRSLQLQGLGNDAREIFKEKGLFEEDKWEEIIQPYRGNPLALKIVATTIQEFFGGSVSEFLKQNTLFLGDFTFLLERQFERLSGLEKETMYWLAIARNPLSISQLRDNFWYDVSLSELLPALDSLGRRSLLNKIQQLGQQALFTLRPVVLKFVTHQFIQQIYRDIFAVLDTESLEPIGLLRSHSIITDWDRDENLRAMQIRLIVHPLKAKLCQVAIADKTFEENLNLIRQMLEEKSPQTVGYAASNIQYLTDL